MTLPIAIHLSPEKRRILFIFCMFLMMGGIAYGIFRFVELSKEVKRFRASPQAATESAKEEVAKLVAKVSSLIAVPQDEIPTVATVSDVEKLKANAFFVNAKNGDKVLIYTSAKKAILYRPDEQKIIEIGPISIGTPSATVATTPLRIVLYNGTNKNGLTKTYETTMKGKTSGFTVIDRDNAKTSDYDKTVLVVLESSLTDKATSLADALGIAVVALPEGEIAPKNTDILIIVGNDAE